MSDQYLILKGFAGLGNRMAALATAVLYAKLSGRTLVVDWRDSFYASDGRNVFSTLFQSPDILTTSPSEITALANSIAPTIWQHQLSCNLPALIAAEEDANIRKTMGQRLFMKYSIDLNKLSHPQKGVVYCSYIEEFNKLRRHFKGELAHLKQASNEDIFAWVFNRELQLAPAIHQAVDDFVATRFAGQSVIGLHIRHTDKSVSLPRYQRAFQAHLATYPDAVFFLATDNRAVEQHFLEAYPDKIVVADKWLPTDGARVHGNANCPDLAQHAAESLIDIVLLSRCDRLIYSRTTSFAQVARMISPTLPPDRCFDIQSYEDQRNKSWQRRLAIMGEALQRRLKKLQAASKLLRP